MDTGQNWPSVQKGQLAQVPEIAAELIMCDWSGFTMDCSNDLNKGDKSVS